MTKLSLKSEKRTLLGRKVKNLRKEGLLPANIFGKKIKSEACQVSEKDFIDIFDRAGETQIIDLSGKPVLITNVQKDPISDKFIHVDFRQVDMSEKISAQVPVEVIGESPAEKQGLGTVVLYLDEVEVEALPGDLPEKFEIDSSALSEVDQAMMIKDIKVDEKKVKILEDADEIVVKVEAPEKEEAPAPVEETTTEGAEKAEGEGVVPEGEEGQAKEEVKEEESKA